MKRTFYLVLFFSTITLCRNNDPFAVILMVKNEEQAIQPTLQPFIDAGIHSYLILDTGSTDNTIKTTQALFAKHSITSGYIVEQPFTNFATSRNYALQCAEEKFPHTMFMIMPDAEWIINNVAGLLQFCKNCSNAPNNSYAIHILINNEISYFTPRFARLHKNIRFVGAVHEILNESAEFHMPENIFFTLNSTKYGIEKSKNRWLRDVTILLQELEKKPSDPRTVYYLGQTYDCLGDTKNAEYFYKLRCNLNGFIEEDYMAHYRLALLYHQTNRCNEALNYYLKSYDIQPMRAEPLIRIAAYYLSTQDYQTAFSFAKMAFDLTYPRYNTLFIEQEMYDYTRYDILGQVAGYVGEFELGEAAVRQALLVKPNEPHLLLNLNAYLDQKKNNPI